ncbi:homeobox protein Hox-A3-like isoform X2 [Mustela erminea]|uniref:homeobox protein Hox-A3-like isoform X2 n=1 Tax=Mustela erminea TaxID=36723 RepID=UPI0013866984|nr:homeobox protein Hox-A3-like isoform X2 [Mustela erminea]
MSPSSVAAFAPLQAPLPGPTPQGFSRSPALPGPPECQGRGSAPLPLAPPPPSHCRGPQDHIVRSSTMECHCPELLRGPPQPPSASPGSPWSPSSGTNPNFTIVENYKPRLCQGSRDFSPGNSYGVRRACFFGSHNLTQVSLKDGDEAHSSRYLKFRYGRLKYLVEVQSLSQISANSEETYNLLLNMSSSFFCFH